MMIQTYVFKHLGNYLTKTLLSSGIMVENTMEVKQEDFFFTMGKDTRDSSCHLLRTHPTLPDVFFTKQYIFFISSATDIAPINRNKAQSRKGRVFCYSFASGSTMTGGQGLSNVGEFFHRSIQIFKKYNKSIKMSSEEKEKQWFT